MKVDAEDDLRGIRQKNITDCMNTIQTLKSTIKKKSEEVMRATEEVSSMQRRFELQALSIAS